MRGITEEEEVLVGGTTNCLICNCKEMPPSFENTIKYRSGENHLPGFFFFPPAPVTDLAGGS